MPVFERNGKIVVNNSGGPVECTTCPCGGGQSCCFGASVPNTLTLTMPSVGDGAGCSGCSTALNNRSFVLSYTTTSTGGQCRYDGTYTGTGISCFGVGDDTILAQITVNATSPGSTNCTVQASLSLTAIYSIGYTATLGNSNARPWTLNYISGSLCNLSTASSVTVN